MLTLEQVVERLADRNLRQVSDRSGIPYITLYNVAKGKSVPHYKTIKAISDYLEQYK